jgi:hypothetical protein
VCEYEVCRTSCKALAVKILEEIEGEVGNARLKVAFNRSMSTYFGSKDEG